LPGIPLDWPTTLSLFADAFQQHAGGFVIWVLRDKFAREGAFEDTLAQPFGTFEVDFNNRFEFADDGEASLNFGNNQFLFGKWRQRNTYALKT